MHKKKAETKKNRQKVSRIIANNFFILKMIYQAAPVYLVFNLVWTGVWSVLDFLQDAFLLRYIINGVQEGKTFEQLLLYIVLITCAIVVSSTVSSVWWNLLSPRMECRIRQKFDSVLMQQARNVDLACFESAEFFDQYIRAMNVSVEKAMEVFESFTGLIWAVISIFTNSFLIFIIDPVLIVFAIIPLLFTFFVKQSKKFRYESEMEITREDRKSAYTQRIFYLNDYAKELRVLNIYKVFFRQFKEAYTQAVIVCKKYGWKMALMEFMSSMGYSVLSAYAATLYSIWQTLGTGRMKYGDCLVVVNSISQVTYTLTDFSSRLGEFVGHSLYIENLRQFLDYQPKIVSGEKMPGHGDVCLQNVSFAYKPGKNVLENVCMQIHQGEKIALVGQNGSGKSTLVKLLLRLYDPTQGQILYADEDIRNLRLAEYRQRYSVVFQDFAKFSLSVRDNVLLRPTTEKDDPVVWDGLRKSGAYDLVDQMPSRLQTILTREFDDHGVVLSGGEYQKLSLARIFTDDSDIVLLDEPSSALDPVAEYRMYENMMNGCEGKTILFISHRMSSAVLADRIFLLEEGKIVEQGGHAELMQKNGKYAQMFRNQAKNYVSDSSFSANEVENPAF